MVSTPRCSAAVNWAAAGPPGTSLRCVLYGELVSNTHIKQDLNSQTPSVLHENRSKGSVLSFLIMTFQRLSKRLQWADQHNGILCESELDELGML